MMVTIVCLYCQGRKKFMPRCMACRKTGVLALSVQDLAIELAHLVPDAPPDPIAGGEAIAKVIGRHYRALNRISRFKCPNADEGGCAKDLALAMGGKLPKREQKRRYCPACVAKEALQV